MVGQITPIEVQGLLAKICRLQVKQSMADNVFMVMQLALSVALFRTKSTLLLRDHDELAQPSHDRQRSLGHTRRAFCEH